MKKPLLALSIAALALLACSNSDDDDAAGSACTAAGGTCFLGGHACTTSAPSASDDCNPSENPGGAFCCLVSADAATSD